MHFQHEYKKQLLFLQISFTIRYYYLLPGKGKGKGKGILFYSIHCKIIFLSAESTSKACVTSRYALKIEELHGMQISHYPNLFTRWTVRILSCNIIKHFPQTAAIGYNISEKKYMLLLLLLLY